MRLTVMRNGRWLGHWFQVGFARAAKDKAKLH